MEEGGIVCNDYQNLELKNCYFELNNPDTYGDIYLTNGIFTTIHNCDSTSVPPYKDLTLDIDCSFLTLFNNNWQGVVTYNGVSIIDWASKFTTNLATWTNHLSNNGNSIFPTNDSTPSVATSPYNYKFFYTSNTEDTIISNFINGYEGQEIWIKVNDDKSTFDFTSPSTSLVGNSGIDYISVNGDMIHAVLLNLHWYCTIIKNT